MCDELELFEFLESDDDEQSTSQMRKRRKLRQQCDPFTLEDREFLKRYRLSKELVLNLCEDLRPYMSAPKKSTDLSVETKVLVALSFYATGSYQRPTGDIGSHSIAQPTVSVVLKEITTLLNLPQMRTKYIKWPQTAEERRANIVRFYNKFGMPGVLGCIDCTHVAIIRPIEHEERYYCRKQYHSLNVQLISDADMKIISVDASYGGATHDSYIWANHPLKSHMEDLNRNESIWLLGDSGYPLRRYMMTPITNASPGTPEAHYTDVHVRTRNVIERTIGLLKARFRCLLVHRVLHYAPVVAASIVNACVILHNMCIQANLPIAELMEEELEEELEQEASMQPPQPPQPHQNPASSNSELNDGLAARRALVARLSNPRQ